ncbi:FkbM family methyltransferase [uncultured Cohaesibacter sp.]|uniref:FkbM family methyltransferase n=1 Tax=uncultured Cohaesibacter sp. TaxID=1002546 RepID=UPI002AAA6589|nr:FkbM family methyltransferase [uncultured Cohaesibacter sp.]
MVSQNSTWLRLKRRAKKLLAKPGKLYRRHIRKDAFTREVDRWFADHGDETLRLDYPDLTKNSVVFDLGGYVGDFAAAINDKYGCKVYLFEPHPDFYKKCVERFKDNNQIVSLNYGVSDVDGSFELSDSVDGSSFLNCEHEGKQTVRCEVRAFDHVIQDLGVDEIDLMKINIEGGEFPLLEYLAKHEMLSIAKDYQIQFHAFIKGAKSKRDGIIDALSKTHERSWCYTFVWENWHRK